VGSVERYVTEEWFCCVLLDELDGMIRKIICNKSFALNLGSVVFQGW
jgi:hypothetical protein